MKGNLVFDAQTTVRNFDDNGYLHVKITPISKACVNPYLGSEIPDFEDLGLEADRIYYALRDPKELEKAVKTFNGLPLLMEHHVINADVQPKEYVVGSTGTDAVFEAPYLKNSLTVTDAEAIKAIEDGSAKEISCAYRFTPDFTPGEYEMDGQKIHYDFVMRNISGNHVALVPEGRAGHDVSVADKKPDFMKRRSEEKLTKKQIILDFKKRRNGLANDANLGIEASEVLSAGFQKALNVIEAQVEGYDPREVGLDIDKDATIDEIIDKFMPGLDEETKTTYKGVLEKLKGETPDAVDAPCGGKDDDMGTPAKSEPAEPMKGNPPPAKDDDWFEEKMKDPAFKEAFEMGIRYGEEREKANPKRIDSEHESEGMKRALGEDSFKNFKEKIVADAKAKAIAETKEHYHSLNKAANKVKPLVGTITDPLAFDSENSIYAFALRSLGKNPEHYNQQAYEGMVDMLLENRPTYPMASDGAFSGSNLDEETSSIFARLDNIV